MLHLVLDSSDWFWAASWTTLYDFVHDIVLLYFTTTRVMANIVCRVLVEFRSEGLQVSGCEYANA